MGPWASPGKKPKSARRCCGMAGQGSVSARRLVQLLALKPRLQTSDPPGPSAPWPGPPKRACAGHCDAWMIRRHGLKGPPGPPRPLGGSGSDFGDAVGGAEHDRDQGQQRPDQITGGGGPGSLNRPGPQNFTQTNFIAGVGLAGRRAGSTFGHPPGQLWIQTLGDVDARQFGEFANGV